MVPKITRRVLYGPIGCAQVNQIALHALEERRGWSEEGERSRCAARSRGATRTEKKIKTHVRHLGNFIEATLTIFQL